jgi:Cft2 family RNA processing exonuclease
MYITDLNSAGGIGANSLLLEMGNLRILVDAGMHPKRMGYASLPDFSILEDELLDAIVLTHCHLDHLGGLPVVARSHPEAPIITSLPNIILAPRMLRNSVNVMKRQRAEHNVGEYPLFVHRDIAVLSRRFEGQRFGKLETYRSRGETFQIALHQAGHVAGAAAIELIAKEGRIIISGDVLFDRQQTLAGANLPNGKADVLILETTRGMNERLPGCTRETEVQRFIATVNRILMRGGSCLIPVFALGRMQEMMTILSNARALGDLKPSPFFVTGLGVDLANHFDKIAKQTGLIDFDVQVIDELGAIPPDPNMVPGKRPSKNGIYLVSSGMLVERTPSYQVAASLLGHSENGICFVGYCDPETPGGVLLATAEGERFLFDVYDYSTPVRASVDQFDLSGHADRDELLDYACSVSPATVVLTHGDQDAREWFSAQFAQALPSAKIIDPKPLERYDLL